MGTVRVDSSGVGIDVEVHGDDAGPAVVLLHGFPDDRTLWRHQVPVLVEAGFRVVAVDQRGFGTSDRPAAVDDYALPWLVGDVVAVLDHLGVARAHVVGHDWGAVVAWVLAATSPQRVDHLVALSVGHPAAFAAAGLAQAEKSWYMLLFQFEGVAEEWLRADGYTNLRTWSRHPDADAAVARLETDGALTAALNWYRANRPPTSWLNGPPPLPAIEAPTLGVWSSDDIALTEAAMTGSAHHVSGPWRYERLDGIGHWIPLEAPEALNRLLLDHLP